MTQALNSGHVGGVTRAFPAVILAAWETWGESAAIYAVNSTHANPWMAGSQGWHRSSTEW
jgi:hypothetical protein